MAQPQGKFEFFGGKGGVGKTTCAAARAVAAARGGERVLVVSTDPAHSLGDAFDVRLSSRVTRMRVAARGRGSLDAFELDAPRAFGRWLRGRRHALGDAIEHGTWLDRHDVDALLGLPIPGIDELIGLIEIVRVSGASPYDRVVVDTAPTGHTLRLLAAPESVRAVSVVLDELQQEHRVIRQQLAGVARPEAADRLIEMLAAQAQVTGALLRNHARTIFRWVTLAEDLALAETADGLAALARGRIHVAEVIVNRVVPAGAACRICDLRRAEERRALARWSASSGTRAPIRVVFEDPREPRGVRRLAPIGERLSGALPRLKRGRVIATRSTRVALRTSGLGIASTPFLSAVAGARLLFFGGKGGVGKTTTASAAAMALARASPGRVLLLSTDPAHSLADVFDVAVGDRPVQIRGAPSNLEVRELDAAAALARRRGDLEAALREIADVVGAGPRARGVSELMDLAPPGIDELFGVLSVITARRAYRTIIIDTAPTGHALRLLALPDAVREWVQVLLRVLLKYRDLLRPGRLATELVALSGAVRHLQQLLRDPAQSRFIVVTRAAEVPRLETERLLQLLRKLRVATPVLIVNARTLQPDGCQRCRTIAAREARELPAIIGAGRRASRDCVIIQTPLAAPPPRGAQPLRQWGDTWLKGES